MLLTTRKYSWLLLTFALIAMTSLNSAEDPPLITTLSEFCLKVAGMTSLENCTCDYFRQFPYPLPPMCTPIVTDSPPVVISTLEEFCQKVVGMTSLENCTCSYFLQFPGPPPFMCLGVNTTRNQTGNGTTEEVKIPLIKDLRMFCKYILHMNDLENCTCSRLNQSGGFCGPFPVELPYDAVFERTCAAIVLFASILGIIGNTIIILLTVKKRKEFGTCKILIAVLALFDLSFCVMQLFFSIPRFWTNEWIYGNAMCKLFTGLLELGALWAVGTIVIIALERYVGIVHSFQRGLTKESIWILLGINLFAGFCWTIPLLVVSEIHSDYERCEETWSNDSQLVYSWLNFIIYFLVPVGLIAYLYVNILLVLYDKSNNIMSVGESDSRIREKRAKDNKRIMTILVSILVAFVLLVLPNRLAWIIYGHDSSIAKRDIDYAIVATYPFHAMINPVIYTLIDSKLRHEALMLVCGCIPALKRREELKNDETRPKSIVSSTLSSSSSRGYATNLDTSVELNSYTKKQAR